MAEGDQIPVQRVGRGVALALGEVELAALEGGPIVRRGELLAHARSGERGELREELGPPLLHEIRELGRVISEVEERP